MASSRPWVLIDSGIGGLVYAQALAQAYPDQSFIYVADNFNFPYGEKSLSALKVLIGDLLNKIETRFDPKGVAFVCNTATVNCLDYFVPLKSYPITGVYPFLGYSLDQPPSQNTLLLATSSTVASEKVQTILSDFPQKLKGLALPALVQLAETGEEKWSYVAREEIQSFKDELKDWQVQEIYLGCTHFIALKDWLEPFFREAHFVDSRDSLVKILSFLKTAEGSHPFLRDFYLTASLGSDELYYQEKALGAGFLYQGVLP